MEVIRFALLIAALFAGVLGVLIVMGRAVFRLPAPVPAGPLPQNAPPGRLAAMVRIEGADPSLPQGAPGAPVRRAGPAPEWHVSGIHTLPDASDALAARIALCEQAEHRIDVQYYLWRGDVSGSLLMQAVHRAADRGVKVRLLLDDNATAGLDNRLAWLDAHPNITLRLFNPFQLRRPRLLAYLLDFPRLNRRMHNKTMIFDDALAVIGGRNIGDEYYNDLSDGGLFMDLDLLTTGPLVADLRTAFDRYWCSDAAFPAAPLLRRATAGAIARGAAEVAQTLGALKAAAFTEHLSDCPFHTDIVARRISFEPVPMALLVDPPEKALGRARRRSLLYPSLRGALGRPEREMEIVSPYFVPRASGRRMLAGYARAGVQVRILTNSLAANDAPIVHSGYAHQRRPLIRAGVELYEFRGDGRVKVGRGLIGRIRRGTSPFARNKLHAKVFSVDRHRVFIGTFNFDPRSHFLNTEMGVLIESPALASELAESFENGIPQVAWRVDLAKGRLRWTREREGEAPEVMRREPGAKLYHRAMVTVGAWLPIEWLL